MIVLDHGVMVEFDDPANLLEKYPEGYDDRCVRAMCVTIVIYDRQSVYKVG